MITLFKARKFCLSHDHNEQGGGYGPYHNQNASSQRANNGNYSGNNFARRNPNATKYGPNSSSPSFNLYSNVPMGSNGAPNPNQDLTQGLQRRHYDPYYKNPRYNDIDEGYVAAAGSNQFATKKHRANLDSDDFFRPSPLKSQAQAPAQVPAQDPAQAASPSQTQATHNTSASATAIANAQPAAHAAAQSPHAAPASNGVAPTFIGAAPASEATPSGANASFRQEATLSEHIANPMVAGSNTDSENRAFNRAFSAGSNSVDSFEPSSSNGANSASSSFKEESHFDQMLMADFDSSKEGKQRDNELLNEDNSSLSDDHFDVLSMPQGRAEPPLVLDAPNLQERIRQNDEEARRRDETTSQLLSSYNESHALKTQYSSYSQNIGERSMDDERSMANAYPGYVPLEPEDDADSSYSSDYSSNSEYEEYDEEDSELETYGSTGGDLFASYSNTKENNKYSAHSFFSSSIDDEDGSNILIPQRTAESVNAELRSKQSLAALDEMMRQHNSKNAAKDRALSPNESDTSNQFSNKTSSASNNSTPAYAPSSNNEQDYRANESVNNAATHVGKHTDNKAGSMGYMGPNQAYGSRFNKTPRFDGHESYAGYESREGSSTGNVGYDAQGVNQGYSGSQQQVNFQKQGMPYGNESNGSYAPSFNQERGAHGVYPHNDFGSTPHDNIPHNSLATHGYTRNDVNDYNQAPAQGSSNVSVNGNAPDSGYNNANRNNQGFSNGIANDIASGSNQAPDSNGELEPSQGLVRKGSFRNQAPVDSRGEYISGYGYAPQSAASSSNSNYQGSGDSNSFTSSSDNSPLMEGNAHVSSQASDSASGNALGAASGNMSGQASDSASGNSSGDKSIGDGTFSKKDGVGNKAGASKDNKPDQLVYRWNKAGAFAPLIELCRRAGIDGEHMLMAYCEYDFPYEKEALSYEQIKECLDPNVSFRLQALKDRFKLIMGDFERVSFKLADRLEFEKLKAQAKTNPESARKVAAIENNARIKLIYTAAYNLFRNAPRLLSFDEKPIELKPSIEVSNFVKEMLDSGELSPDDVVISDYTDETGENIKIYAYKQKPLKTEGYSTMSQNNSNYQNGAFNDAPYNGNNAPNSFSQNQHAGHGSSESNNNTGFNQNDGPQGVFAAASNMFGGAKGPMQINGEMNGSMQVNGSGEYQGHGPAQGNGQSHGNSSYVDKRAYGNQQGNQQGNAGVNTLDAVRQAENSAYSEEELYAPIDSHRRSNKTQSAIALIIQKIQEKTGINIDDIDVTPYGYYELLNENRREANFIRDKSTEEGFSNYIKRMYESSNLNPNYTFSHLSCDVKNSRCFISAQRFASEVASREEAQLFLVIGAMGSGKTCLSHAVGNMYIEEKHNLRQFAFDRRYPMVRITTYEEIRNSRFFTMGESSDSKQSRDELYKEFCNVDLLIIDGICMDGQALDSFGQRVISDVFKTRASKNRPVMVTSTVSIVNFQRAIGNLCYESMRCFNVTGSSLEGGSRRNKIMFDGKYIN